MAEDTPDFDNERDSSAGGPPLPPDDRLWRHPSELSSPASPFGQPGIRRRASYASTHRAGALSAGFVGAMLAAGLVLVASHFPLDQSTPPGGDGATTVAQSPRSPSGLSTEASVSTLPSTGAPMSNGLTDVVERISDASVSIEALGAQGTVRGSGLIIGSDGVVLTAAALVDGSTTLNVWLSNGTPEMATFVGSDAATGIAVLQLPKRGLPTISSVPPGRLVVHDIVALVTNTTTATNVSFSLVHALDASYESPSGQTLMDEIATDMVPGFNTLGSAVIDGRGNVIGVVVESEGTETLATPMWLALGVADEIAAKGVVVPGWLGINGVDDDASGIPDGVRVLGVTSRGAAQAAGVEPGDVIQAVDGASVPTVSALQAHLYCLEPGAMVRLTVLRGKQERTAEAVLALAPAA